MEPAERFAAGGYTGEIAAGCRPEPLAEAVARLLDPGSAVETLHWGRNYIYRAPLPRPPWPGSAPAEAAVKQFREQGLKDRLRRRLSGGKAAKSWRVARALTAAGIATPEPLLVAAPDRPGGASYFVTAHLAGVFEARYLFRAIAAGEAAERFPQVDIELFFTALGRAVRRLHDAGFFHRDLSSGNVLVDWRGGGQPPELYLVDLNRARVLGAGRRPGLSRRTRDLCRLAIFEPGHRRRYLEAYWGGPPPAAAVALYRAYQGSFLAKNRAKAAIRGAAAGAVRWARDLVLPRRPHAHIPAAPDDAAVRDRTVWDPLSDQPHQHAGKLTKLGVRLADAGAHAREAAAAAAAAPRIWRRYRELAAGLHRRPVPWAGAGVCVRPWPADPAAPVEAVAGLGVGPVLVRLHPWESGHDAEAELAAELARRGHELTFALPQNRELVRDPGRWRAALEEIGERFTPHGGRFVVGQAINRSKWGVWTLAEYLRLAEVASEVLRRWPGVELLGPGVIDFELHATAAAVNLGRGGVRFDALASLLYVDRRGAPENRQAGFDTVGKVTLLKAIADTARHCAGRSWITEVNWPLREGPHAPAGRSVAVDEQTQADYLARYYLLALGSGMVERVFWWQAIARGYGLVAPEDGRLRRRPAFGALAALERLLAGAEALGPVPGAAGGSAEASPAVPVGEPSGRAVGAQSPAPPEARLHRFRLPGGDTLIAAWSAAPPGSPPVEADLPAPPTAAWDRDGAELPPPPGRRVRLTGSPRYYRL